MKICLILFAFLMVIVASCMPVVKPTPTATYTPSHPLTPTPEVPTDIPTPLPEQSFMPIITPDAGQVAHWKEYQTELARRVLADGGGIYPYPETALCEWDILGRSGQEMYVWVICSAPNSGNSIPAVIHLNTDGSIQKVEVPVHGSKWKSNIQRLFPSDVQEKINEYFASSNTGIPEELRIHLQYRLAAYAAYPDVPPLIILSVMPAATLVP